MHTFQSEVSFHLYDKAMHLPPRKHNKAQLIDIYPPPKKKELNKSTNANPSLSLCVVRQGIRHKPVQSHKRKSCQVFHGGGFK